ncbi:hypothetical protein Agub_g221, partial [Astrephomene gubernaculifera]
LRQALSEHALIPTASSSGELRRPSELHDPRVAALSALLPPASTFFPAPALAASSPRLLDALAQLGMARTADMRVFLTAARALHDEHAAAAAVATVGAAARPPLPSPPAGGGAAAAAAASAAAAAASVGVEESLLPRARALLKHLESWAAQRAGTSSAARGEEEQRCWSQLAGLSWSPVVKEAPEPGLPWSSAQQPLLAPPRLCRPPGDAWLVSATLHILERPVGQQLAAALGWDMPPRVSVLAAQLLETGRLHAHRPTGILSAAAVPSSGAITSEQEQRTEGDSSGVAAGSSSSSSETEVAAGSAEATATDAGSDSNSKAPASVPVSAGTASLIKALDRAVHLLYGALSQAIDGSEGDLVMMSFERQDSPVVWVGEAFVTPGSAALHFEGDFRPYLWVVPEPLHQYDKLLALMGVHDRFTAQHFAAGLAGLASAASGSPLDDTALALALQLADCAADALAAYGVRPTGHFFVPDASSVMAPASELFFNDAEWLDTRDVQLAHGALPQATAEALGVRSLRYSAEVEAQRTAVLPCPSPAELRERLGLQAQAESSVPTATATASAAAAAAAAESAAATFLFELLEVADALGSRGLRLVLDRRHHPAQSLLQPALAAFQGPALCAVMPDVVLSAEEVAGLVGSRAQPPAVRGRATAYSAGLQSAFLVSELLQVVSGSCSYMFDPSGAYLGGSTGSGAGAGGSAGRSSSGSGPSRSRHAGGLATPRAKQYLHVSSDLTTTFADQFAVWSFAEGYDIRQHVSATLI